MRLHPLTRCVLLGLARGSASRLAFVFLTAFVTAPVLAQSVPFNRGLDDVEVVREGGRVGIRLSYVLLINDPTRSELNLNADVEVYLGGELADLHEANATKNGAITCAVTCAGACPSIFGDGVCTGCGCKYNNWFTSWFGED